MIHENLTLVEPKSLRLILRMISFVLATALILYMIKPQYQQFSQNSASFKMLNSQIDNQTQLQQTIDDERKKI